MSDLERRYVEQLEPPESSRARLKLSIVMPSYNQAEFLEESLLSLIEQQELCEGELEIIVMDGGSDDGSSEIIRKYEKHIAYWISQPDGGQTDALIKGFQRATGDIFGWLCSDDLLLPWTVREVLDHFTNNPDDQAVYGDSAWIDRDGRFIKAKNEIPFNWFIWVYNYNYIPQPSTFWRRALYEEVGGLDPAFDCAMDADLWARFAQRSVPRHRPRPWSWMRSYPEQKNQRLRAKSDEEDLRIRRRLGYRMEPPMLRTVLRILAKLWRGLWRTATGCFGGRRSSADQAPGRGA